MKEWTAGRRCCFRRCPYREEGGHGNLEVAICCWAPCREETWQRVDRLSWQDHPRVGRRLEEWDFVARLTMTNLRRYSCLSLGAEREGRSDQRVRLGWERWRGFRRLQRFGEIDIPGGRCYPVLSASRVQSPDSRELVMTADVDGSR